MYETDVYMNVGCDGFQIRNAGIYRFQSRKLRGVLCADAGYLMKRKTHFGYFHAVRIIRRARYRAEITVMCNSSTFLYKLYATQLDQARTGVLEQMLQP